MNKATKKELKEIKKNEWELKAAKSSRDAKIRKIMVWGGSLIGFLIFLGLLVWLVSSPTGSNSDSGLTVAPVSSKDIYTGPANAKSTVIEYADFQCPACKAYHDQILLTLIPAYKDKVKFVYRFFPLTTIHKNSMIAAQAGYAAYLQGKFWEYGDMLFQTQNDWAALSDSDARSNFYSYAEKLGLNLDKFKKDIDSDAAKAFINDEKNEGLNAGVNSTPTFLLNGKQISAQTYEEFKKVIDDSLKTTK